jgi:hypothetical protein
MNTSILRKVQLSAIVATGLLAVACAGVPSPEAVSDGRAGGVSTRVGHEVIAADHRRLAENERLESARHEAWAAQERQLWAEANQGRALKSSLSMMGSHCEMESLAHARAAEEQLALAEKHHRMALELAQ